jgi:hypothetical protein
MKVNVFLFCLFLSVNALAQSKDTTGKDTARHFMIVDARSPGKYDKPLYVVDGIIYKGNIRRIKPESILQIAILKQPGATNIYGKDGENGVVIIETLKFGIEYCHRKLSSFSIAYRDYLDVNKNDDSGLVYLLDGIVLEGKRNEIIKKLYDAIEKIKSVDFIEKFSAKLNTNNAKPIVVITTKQ